VSKEQLDNIFKKWISRKLMVFLVACAGLFTGVLTSSDWVIIATAYVGAETFITAVEKLKR
jgi:hypothetical protein